MRQTLQKMQSPKKRGLGLTYCTVDGCSEETSHLKPYCLQHITRLAYPRQIVVETTMQNVELTFAEKGRWRRINPLGDIATDILRTLWVKGPQTPKRVSTNLGLSKEALSSYITSLVAADLICHVEISSRRGGTRWIVYPTQSGHHRIESME